MKVAIAHDPTKPGPPFQIVLNVLSTFYYLRALRKKHISDLFNGNHKKWSSNNKNFLGERIFNTFYPLGM